MQIFAYDKRGKAISADRAEKKINYFCPECKQSVRVRGGFHRRNHFFHFLNSSHCRLGKKSDLHFFTQLALARMLFPLPLSLEVPFQKISRIADLYVPQCKLVIEVQGSPIDPEEVENRIHDYACLGLTTLWILHEITFNKKNIHPAEQILKKHAHYYTNIDREGRGMVYDLFSLEEGYRRVKSTARFPIDLKQMRALPSKIPPQLAARKMWRISYGGDILHAAQGREMVQKLIRARPTSKSLFLAELKKAFFYLFKGLFNVR